MTYCAIANAHSNTVSLCCSNYSVLSNFNITLKMATASTSELKDTLAQYEAQYDQVDISYSSNGSFIMFLCPQVEAALTNEPDNEELLKLKSDLTVC